MTDNMNGIVVAVSAARSFQNETVAHTPDPADRRVRTATSNRWPHISPLNFICFPLHDIPKTLYKECYFA